jgi:subtilisin family serine protease
MRLVLFALVVFFCCHLQAQSSTSVDPLAGKKYVPGQILVRFRPGVAASTVRAAHLAVAADVIEALPGSSGLQLVRIPTKASLAQTLASYRSNPNVLYAEPDYVVHSLQTPNDPFFTEMWQLLNTGQSGGTLGADIRATQAWNITTGSSNVVIAVIDTGVDYNHPDLAANIFSGPICPGGIVCHGINTVPGTGVDPNDPLDDNGHGTHISGTIGAVGNNSVGVVGINWNVKILPCKFLNSQGSGDVANAIKCLDFIKSVKDSGTNIVASNNSWGGGPFSQALQDAIDRQRQSGILFIAAAGNDFADNDQIPTYPAGFPLPNIIAVAATDRNDRRAFFSNIGQHTVHLGAPGQDIVSTFLGGQYAVLSGTSMATPQVTGVAALLAAQDPTLDWRAIKNLILAGGVPNADLAQTITGRRLDAFGALTCANSTVESRLTPVQDIISGSAGVPVTLSAININCAQPNGAMQVTVSPGGQIITLADDGAGVDLSAGDGIYSGTFTPPAPGVYNLAFSTGGSVTIQVLNNYQPALTSFSYRTITGTDLDLDDDGVAQIVSPFNIAFGNGSFTNLWVSANGTISLSGPFSDYVNGFIPSASPFIVAPSKAISLIAPFWDDLFPVKGTAQNVFWQVTGTAPDRELVVEWRDVRAFDCAIESDTVKFQVVFFENSSDVLFNYGDAVFGGSCDNHDRGSSATVGLQVSPQSGTLWSFGGQDVNDGLAIVWHVSNVTPPAPGPAQLLSLSPSAVSDLSPDTILTVNGTNFTPQSRVTVLGGERLTTFVSSTQLTALIPASDLDLFRLTLDPRPIQVNNPSFVESTNSLDFTVLNLPNPSITSFLPASAPTGGFSFQLKITGANFSPTASVTWNGQTIESTVGSRTEITAVVLQQLLIAPGPVAIRVINPAPGGGTSAPISFNVSTASSPAFAASQSYALLHTRKSTTAVTLPLPKASPRFLGWNYSSRQGPEYLQRFIRPYASQFSAGTDKSSAVSANLGSSAVVPPPLPGLNLRDSLLSGFLPSGVVTGDFNRDGHMDWIVSNAGSSDLWVYLGNGDGTAQPPRVISLAGTTPVGIATASLRGNGILDLVVVESDSASVGVLLGNGDGTFAPENLYFVPEPPISLALADVNGDGHLDVIAGLVTDNEPFAPLATLAGDGTGRLSAPVLTQNQGRGAPLAFNIAVADLNRDGKPDVVITDLGGEPGVYSYLGTGDGTFKLFKNVLESIFIESLNTALADLNGDGCPDMVTLTQFGGVTVGIGTCDGGFRFDGTPNGVGQGEGGIGMALVDINGDGKLDLVTGGVNLQVGDPFVGAESGSLVSVSLGDGTGNFDLARVYRAQSGMFGIAVADLNGDGHPDIIAPSQDADSVTVLMNDGLNGFGDPQGVYTGWDRKDNPVSGGVANPNEFIYAFDVNGDGFKDLVFVDSGQFFPLPHVLSVKLNDGTGHFLPEIKSPVMDGTLRFGELAHGDFRHTGREDLILIPSQFTPELSANFFTFVPNTGAGTFGAPVVTNITHPTGTLAVGDFNGDGNLDFAMVGFGGPSNTLLFSIFLGNGDGTFRTGPTQTLPSTFPPGALFVGDFNGDGKKDILVAADDLTNAGTLYEFLGNGDGSFAPPRAVLTNFLPGTVPISPFFAVGDFNHDGRTDVVQRNPLVPVGAASFNIYLAQPDGSLAPPQNYTPFAGSEILPLRSPLQFVSDFVGDFNGDGNLDIAAFQGGGPNGKFVQFLLGNEDGTFTPSFNSFPLEGGIGTPSLVTDFNNDGRDDLLELDGATASYHVISSIAGISLRMQFASLPIIGGTGAVQVSLALPATQNTTVGLTSSDPGISVAPSVTIPAGSRTLNVPVNVSPGFDTSHTFKITATSGTETVHTLGVAAVPGAAIGIVTNTLNSSQVVLAGATTGDYGLGLGSRGGYSTTLSLTCNGLPAGASCQFGDSSVVIPPGIFAGTSLTVATSTSLPVGNYNFNVVASDPSITQVIPLTLKIGDFNMILTSAFTPVALPTGFAGYSLEVDSINQFGGAVFFTCNGLPAGATCQQLSFALPGETVQFNLTTQNVAPGNYPFVLSGVNGNVTHTANGVLQVGGFGSAAISPASATLAVGQSANFSLSVTSVNGFSGSVLLGCLPNIGGRPVNGVLCTFAPQQATFDANGKLTSQLTVIIASRPASTVINARAVGRLGSTRALALMAALILPALLFVPRKNARRIALSCVVAMAMCFVVSCGGGGGAVGSGGGGSTQPSGPQAVSVDITVFSSAQSFQQKVGSLTVNVQ